ncbi:MAG TPA: ABC transporter permease subunit [Anaerolineales bacterium]|nr:ABC transporter permease subunit [Anaerolineales bacterium]
MRRFREYFSYLLNPRTSTSLKRLIEEENDGDALPPPPSITWRQVLSYPPLVLGILIVSGLILVIWFAPQWSSYDPYLITQTLRPYYDATLKKMVTPPFPISPTNPLGTDQWGNDLLSLVLYGARVTLIAGLYITLTRILLGTILGLVAGWHEGSFADKSINGVGTVMGSVPVLLSSIVLIYALDIYKGLWVFVVALSLIGWFETAQLVRGEVLRIKRTDYVEAAGAIGLNNLQIVIRHVLPNVTAYLIVIAVLEMGAVLLLLAELAFLGVIIGGGTRYNDDPFSSRVILLREVPEWGAMVAQGVRYIRSYPAMVLVPGFAYFISIAGVNALGEGLRWMFTRWPFSMGNLLKKRTVVFAGALVLVSAVILNQTSPEASFAGVSRAITAEKIQGRVDLLMQMQAEAGDDAGEAVAEYIADQMQDMDIALGWHSNLNSSYHYEYETVVKPLLATPKLATFSDAGQPAEIFAHQTDFILAPDQPMENVSLQGEIIIVDPQAEKEDWSFDGQIVMTLESLAPVNYSQFVAAHGGRGLLLIADTPTLTCARETANMPTQIRYYEFQTSTRFSIRRLVLVEGDPQPLPTLRITPEAALRILNADDIELDVFTEPDWEIKALRTSAVIELEFGQGEQISVNNAIGYIGGYDIDNAHETVLLYAPYDTSTGRPDNLLSAALMLEMMQAWHESDLDPRRSAMFIAWDRANLGSPGAQTFMDEKDNYRLLTPAVPAANVEPIMLWDLSMNGSMDDDLAVSPSSDETLLKLFANASKNFRAQTSVAQPATCQSHASALLPSLSLTSAERSSPTPEFSESFGRTVSLAVLKVLRLPNY